MQRAPHTLAYFTYKPPGDGVEEVREVRRHNRHLLLVQTRQGRLHLHGQFDDGDRRLATVLSAFDSLWEPGCGPTLEKSLFGTGP